MKELEELSLIRRVRTGRQSVFILEEWEEPGPKIFYLHQRFGRDGQRQIVVEDEGGEASEVDAESTSDVNRSRDQAREVDRESTSEVDSRCISERRCAISASSEVDSPCTSEVDSPVEVHSA